MEIKKPKSLIRIAPKAADSSIQIEKTIEKGLQNPTEMSTVDCQKAIDEIDDSFIVNTK